MVTAKIKGTILFTGIGDCLRLEGLLLESTNVFAGQRISTSPVQHLHDELPVVQTTSGSEYLVVGISRQELADTLAWCGLKTTKAA